eukprot:837015-Pyramimonas_sp.AAC.1
MEKDSASSATSGTSATTTTTVSSWNTLRKMLKKKLVKAHLLADRAHVQADPDGVAAADSLETADSLGSGSAAIASAPEEDMPTGLGPVATVKRMLTIDRKLGARLKAFATA